MLIFLPFLLLQLTIQVDGRTIFPSSNQMFENDHCIDPNGVEGKCVPYDFCPDIQYAVLELKQHPIICSWNQQVPIICCPSFEIETNAPNLTTFEPTPIPVTENLITGIDLTIVTSTTDQPNVTETENSFTEVVPSQFTPINPTSTTKSTSEQLGKLNAKVNCGVKAHIPALAIEGGEEVKSELEWPWMASLFFVPQYVESDEKIYRHFCGGTIISESLILTAAHCLDTFNNHSHISELYVGVGSNDLEDTTKYSIRKIIIHPDYVIRQSYSDIALLVTSKPIDFNDTMIPICLPGPSLSNLTSTKESWIQVAGWGRQSFGGLTSPRLRSARLDIFPNDKCNQSYTSLLSSFIPEGIKGDQLCAGTWYNLRDACSGDSGGPLTIRIPKNNSSNIFTFYQIGVVSFGHHCADKNYPGIYTRITDYVPWIQQRLALQEEESMNNDF